MSPSHSNILFITLYSNLLHQQVSVVTAFLIPACIKDTKFLKDEVVQLSSTNCQSCGACRLQYYNMSALYCQHTVSRNLIKGIKYQKWSHRFRTSQNGRLQPTVYLSMNQETMLWYYQLTINNNSGLKHQLCTARSVKYFNAEGDSGSDPGVAGRCQPTIYRC